MGLGALVAVFVTSSGSLTLAGSIALFAASTVASTLIGKALAPGGPGINGRNITSRGTVDAQAIVYGEAVVAGTIAYRNTHGNKNAGLWAVHCLAGHEVSDITDIYLDDDLITDSQINGGSSAGGGVTTGTYGPTRTTVNTVEVWKHLGTSTQTVDTNLQTADTFNEWTSSHRLRGIAYIVTKFWLNDRTEAVWEAGDPTNVRAKVRGKIVYDPRLDTSPGANPDNASYFAWTDNPALCVADYLRDAKFSPLAGGVDAARIDWDAVESAADDCDTLVFVPPAASPSNTEKRFTCNGVIYGTASPEDNLKSLLSSMNGSLDFVEGNYVIRAGVYESPADTLDENDIIGPIGVRTSLESDQRVNTIKAAFINPEKSYQADTTAPITISAYKDTRDGGDELFESIQLPMTDSNTMAQRIALKRLYEANQELTITVPCNLKAARLVPGERVNVEITERGWSPKVFKVLDWELFDRGGDQVGVNVTLREDDSSAYADPDVSDYNTYTAGTLTKGTPEPIPSVDSIPRGIRYGEGEWSIELTNNATSAGANDGEVLFSVGRFVLPDGTIRPITTAGAVYTPFETSIVPPDGRFYIIWGATNPQTRFSSSPLYVFGESTQMAAGLFAAIYDRFSDQWYAVTNSNGEEIAFTPADTDYVVATGTKTSASGGIDSLTALVSFQEYRPPPNTIPSEFSDFETINPDDAGIPWTSASDFSRIDTDAFLGEHCLEVSYSLASAGLRGVTLSRQPGPQTYNVIVRPNRRHIVIVRIKPTTSQAASSDAEYFLGCDFSDATTVNGTTITGDELTEDEWNECRYEIDATAVSARSLHIDLQFRNLGSSGTHTHRFDAVQIIDATDFPEIQEGVN